ncbi:MAG: protoporphyrinogen/coproporphyrinogen oxidase [Solirubrobacteraceae bacterium]
MAREKTSIVVVGAGLSGLSAARRLERAGIKTTVLEAGPTPGGRVRTERTNGYVVDVGPDAATAGYERWLALIDELGLTPELTEPSGVLGIVKHGRIVDIDPAKPLQALTTKALSRRAKLNLATGLLPMIPSLRRVDSYEMNRSAELDDPDTCARELSYKSFGPEVSERLIDPVMRLVTGSGASEASTLGLLGALGAWSSPLVNIRGGLAAVSDALAKGRGDLRCNSEVREIAEHADGVTVSYRAAETGRIRKLDADGCVIAAMYGRARTIWPRLDDLHPTFAAELRDVKLVAVSLGYDRLPDTNAYVVLVPTVEDRETLLIFMQHNKAPDRAPAGHALITLYTDTLVTDEYLEKTDEEIETWASGVIELLCPELEGHRELAIVTRWPHAGYLASPGFWRRSKELLGAIAPEDRVQLAGDLFGAGSMESAVRWGERAADRLIARPGGAARANGGPGSARAQHLNGAGVAVHADAVTGT